MTTLPMRLSTSTSSRRRLFDPSLLVESGLVTTVFLLSSGLPNESLRIGGPDGRAISQLFLLPAYGVCVVLLAYHARTVLDYLRRIPFTLLLLAVPLSSLAWTIDGAATLAKLIALTLSVAFAVYAAGRYTLPEIVLRVAIALMIAAAVNVGYTLLNPEMGLMSDSHLGAWRGVYAQKNGLARAMVLGTATSVCVAISIRYQPRTRILGWMGASLCFMLVLLTTSATGLLATVIAVTAIVLSSVARRSRPMALIAVTLLPLVMLGVGTVVALRVDEAAAVVGRDLTLTGRTIVWVASLGELRASPILGFGYGAFWRGWDGPSGNVWAQLDWEPGDSHNGFIDTALDGGMVGLVLLLLHLVVVASRAVRVMFSERGGDAWPAVVVVLFVIYNLTESVAFRPTNLFWLVYLIASVRLALDRRVEANGAVH